MRTVTAHILEHDDVRVVPVEMGKQLVPGTLERKEVTLWALELQSPIGAASLHPRVAWFKSRHKAEDAAEQLRAWLRETGCMR